MNQFRPFLQLCHRRASHSSDHCTNTFAKYWRSSLLRPLLSNQLWNPLASEENSSHSWSPSILKRDLVAAFTLSSITWLHHDSCTVQCCDLHIGSNLGRSVNTSSHVNSLIFYATARRTSIGLCLRAYLIQPYRSEIGAIRAYWRIRRITIWWD